MLDLMIDIETLGNRPGSIVLTIGAIAFDAETGDLGEEFYAAINPASAAAVGLTTDVPTVTWWMHQSEAARAAAFSGIRDIGEALTDLVDFFQRIDPSHLWAKPPSFDIVLLEAAFRACNIPVPWHYSLQRDCRTLFKLTDIVQPTVGTAHNALDDAKAQALGVIDACRLLPGRSSTDADYRPRYSTKRMHDEIEKAREYGRQQAREELAAAGATPAPETISMGYQARVAIAHGPLFDGDPTDVPERRDRNFEESCETAQAFEMTLDEALALVKYTWSRPPGDRKKELGSQILTAFSLAELAGIDAREAAEADLDKLQQPETIARIRAKRATRHGRGSLPGLDPSAAVPGASK